MANCFVTGAASGIGLGLVDRLSADGHRVHAADIDLERLQRRAEERRWLDPVHPVALDVRDARAWSRRYTEAESNGAPVDILVNCAGVLHPGWTEELQPEQVSQMVDVNFKGVVFGTQCAAASMVSRRRGHIINVGSLSAYAPVPGIHVYGATKAAVRSFTLAAAMDLSRRGVAVTLVNPDPVETPMLDDQRAHDEAAITFSAPRALSVDEVVEVICGRVIAQRPMEVAIPRHRGWVGKAGGAFPEVARHFLGPLRDMGRKKQSR